MRLIDAEELKRELKIWCYNRTTTTPTFSFVTEKDIDECPTADVLEQIRAEILNFKEKCNASDYLGCGILEIIDKYR